MHQIHFPSFWQPRYRVEHCWHLHKPKVDEIICSFFSHWCCNSIIKNTKFIRRDFPLVKACWFHNRLNFILIFYVSFLTDFFLSLHNTTVNVLFTSVCRIVTWTAIHTFILSVASMQKKPLLFSSALWRSSHTALLAFCAVFKELSCCRLSQPSPCPVNVLSNWYTSLGVQPVIWTADVLRLAHNDLIWINIDTVTIVY